MLFASSLFYFLVVCLLLELAYNDLRPVKTPPFSGLQTVTMMVVVFVGEDEDDEDDEEDLTDLTPLSDVSY